MADREALTPERLSLRKRLAALEAYAGVPPRFRKDAIDEANLRRTRAGLPMLSQGTVSDWFSRGGPAKDFADLWAVVEVLLEWAGRRAPATLRDRTVWKLAWEAAAADRRPPGPRAAALREADEADESGVNAGAPSWTVELARELFIGSAALPSRPLPSFLLRSGYEVVPFRSRAGELADALAWSQAEDQVAVRLYFAPGGQGKTRFAQQLVHDCEAAGWAAGLLRSRVDDEALGKLLRLPEDVLVVIDYAEIRMPLLDSVFERLTRREPGLGRLRLVLLARTAASWWEELCGRAPDLVAALLHRVEYELPPVFQHSDDRSTDFLAAVSAFARAGGYRADGLAPPSDLDDDRYAHALTLHMTALAMLLDHQDDPEHARESPRRLWNQRDPAERVLAHERRYWSDAAHAVGLPHADARILDAVMTAATLCGAPDREASVRLLGALPDLAGENHRVLGRYADWVHGLHPGQDWLNPLEPDLLGEYFIQRTLTDQDELVAALARAALSADQAYRLLTVLVRGIDRDTDMAAFVSAVLQAGNDGLWLTGTMLAAYLPEPRVLTGPLHDSLASVTEDDVVIAAATELPRSHRVAQLKIATAREALRRHRLKPQRDPAVEAALLEELAAGLFYDQRENESVDTARELIKLYGRLAKQRPDRYTAKLALAMLNYGDRRQRAGDTKEALDLAKQAVHLSAGVPADDRHELLSKAYDLRSRVYKDLGRQAEAVTAAEHAVREGKLTTGAFATAWQPMLLMNLSNRYAENGDGKRALLTIGDAVDQMREIEMYALDPLSPNMPQMLLNYAQCLAEERRFGQAREIIAEAAQRLQRLVASQPKFADMLGMAAGRWRHYLRESGEATDEARSEYQTMTQYEELAAELTYQNATAGDTATGIPESSPPRRHGTDLPHDARSWPHHRPAPGSAGRTPTDHGKAVALLERARSLQRADPISAITQAKTAQAIFQRLRDRCCEGDALYLIGNAHLVEGHGEKAARHFRQAAERFDPYHPERAEIARYQARLYAPHQR